MICYQLASAHNELTPVRGAQHADDCRDKNWRQKLSSTLVEPFLHAASKKKS